MTVASEPASSPWASARGLLAWWSGELSDLLTSGGGRSPPWKVMLLRGAQGCDVLLRTRGQVELIGTWRAGDNAALETLRRRLGRQSVAPAEIVLRLQPGEVVQARLNVPAAAGDVLEPILRNQIERLAPWPVDKALFAYEVAPAVAGSATLDVALTITGRSLVEGLVADLAGAGVAPGVVDYGAEANAEPRLNLLAARDDGSRKAGRLLLSAVGVACLAALIAGAVGTAMLVQQTHALGGVSARLEELRARSASELPSQASQRRQAWLLARKAAQPSMAVVLEALSRALPDDTWLNRLEVEQGVARVAGFAGNAAALIAPIEASGHFAEVKFAAPTTLVEEDSLESFTISGRIVPGRRLE